MANEVVVKEFLHRYEAEMAKGLLDNEHIPCRISPDDFTEGRGAVGFRSPIQLRVNKEDLVQAKQALAILDNPQ